MSCIGTLDALDDDVLVCPLAKENMNELKNHPLLITLRDAISGDGFLAGITLSGRALMRKEDDGKWWMYGVRPAALAESGTTIEEAFLRFRGRYREVLFDIAQENSSFEDFRKEVERLFYEPDADGEDERLWEDALTAIRTGKASAPDEFSALDRKSPETNPSQITVELLSPAVGKRFMPSDNVRDTYSIPTALAA
jgi:hypothetical protein